jgi:hypothetical protein
MDKPLLDPFPFDTEMAGIVIVCNTGIRWTNQAGGTTCAHPEAEGIFIPLPPFLESSLEILRDRWHLDASDIKYVRRFLTAEELDRVMEYDPTMMGGEAWVPVRILPAINEAPTWANSLKPFAGCNGFIVYQNSD